MHMRDLHPTKQIAIAVGRRPFSAEVAKSHNGGAGFFSRVSSFLVASMEKEKEGKISADEQVNYQPSVETSDGDAAPSVAAGAIHNINNHADSPPTQLSSAHSTALPLNGNEHLTVQDIDACESVRPQSPSSLTIAAMTITNNAVGTKHSTKK